MEMAQLVEIYGMYGMSVVIIAYFLYKDYKFNEQLLSVLGEVKEVLAELRTWHESEGKK